MFEPWQIIAAVIVLANVAVLIWLWWVWDET